MKFKIVTDSSSDVLSLSKVPFEATPLKIITDKNEYIDNENLDVGLMVNDLDHYKGKSSTSCPNQNDWLCAFGDSQAVFCVTITGTLSGSFNSAMAAKTVYEEMYPERKVFVLDSLSTGPEMFLIIEKIEELILKEYSFEDICKEITEYSKNTGLIFMLQSMKNLANNGRVKPIVAKMAGILGIRVVGKASDIGDLMPLDKSRGEDKALESIVKRLEEDGFKRGKVRIAHCFNKNGAEKLKALIEKRFNCTDIKIYSCRGLCSYYAENGGMLIGFEKTK